MNRLGHIYARALLMANGTENVHFAKVMKTSLHFRSEMYILANFMIIYLIEQDDCHIERFS